MSRFWPAALIALVAGTACNNDSTAPAPKPDAPAPAPAPPSPEEEAERAALQRAARQFALALADPTFRSYVKQSLEGSPFRESKLPFQRFTAGSQHPSLRQALALDGAPAMTLGERAAGAPSAEFYFPVERHRLAWTGDDNILVATALRDHEAPVAFDLKGSRRVLDPETPPAIPVLAVVPQELDFDSPMAAKCLTEECTSPWGGGGGTAGGGGGGGGTGSVIAGDLRMSYAEFDDDYEGWLKGKPEYEIHIMGPRSQSDTSVVVSYQCIGEYAGGAYTWDSNDRTWSGNVMLFSDAQLASFETAYPETSFLIYAVEDDDTACVIKTNGDREKAVLHALETAVNSYKGARGTPTLSVDGIRRQLEAGKSGVDFIDALVSFIKTQDEAIGFAVADSVAGRSHHTGNWVILNQDLAPAGWLRLNIVDQ